MKKVIMQTIPFDEMRYPTYGDYWEDGHTVRIDVAEQKNPLYEWLIALHELVEYILVKARKISIDEIEEFDQTNQSTDPGDDPTAPYYHEHQVASIVERIICNELCIKWADYENEIQPDYFSFSQEPSWLSMPKVEKK